MGKHTSDGGIIRQSTQNKNIQMRTSCKNQTLLLTVHTNHVTNPVTSDLFMSYHGIPQLKI